MKTPTLIINCESILVSDPFERFWELVSTASEAEAGELQARFHSELGDAYLRGELPEPFLWRWLAGLSESGSEQLWRECFLERLYPLLPLGMVCRFAESAEVHLISELRAEWLVPLLQSEGVIAHLSSAQISSRVRELRPELYALPQGDEGESLIIASEPSAPAAAQALGYRALAADPEMEWIETAIEWLSKRSGKRWRGLWVPRAARAQLEPSRA